MFFLFLAITSGKAEFDFSGFQIDYQNLATVFNYGQPPDCLQFQGDGSDFQERVFSYLASKTGYLVVTDQGGVHCSIQVIVGDIAQTNRTVYRTSIYKEYSAIYIFNNNSDNELENFRQRMNEVRIKPNALLVNMATSLDVWSVELPSSKFIKKDVARTWPQKVQIPMNFAGREIIVSTFNCTPFAEVGPVDEAGVPSWYSGAELDLVLEAAQRVGLDWRLKAAKGRWGYQEEDGSWSKEGLLPSLLKGSTDVGLCSLWLTEDKAALFRLSSPMFQMCTRLLVPRPRRVPTPPIVFSMFRPLLWAAVAVAASFVLVVLILFDRCRTRPTPTLGKSVWAGVKVVYKGLLGSSGGGGLVGLSWEVTCLLLSAIFCSRLVSQLTAPSYTRRLDTPRDLVEAGFSWGNTFYVNVQLLFDVENPWERKFAERFKMETEEEHERNMASDKYCLVAKNVERVIVPDLREKPKLMKNYEAGRHCRPFWYTVIATPPGSPYLVHLEYYLERAKEAGLHTALLVKHSRTLAASRPYVLEAFHSFLPPRRPHSVIKLSDLGFVFSLLFFGLLFSTVAFIFEVTCTAKS